MSHLVKCRVLLFICCISKSTAFLPTKTAGDSNSTFTHSDITTIGINKAVSQFLVEHNLAINKTGDAIGKFFGADSDQKAVFYSKISEVITASNTLQGGKFKEAKYSVNGEQIDEARGIITHMNAQTFSKIFNLRGNPRVRNSLAFCVQTSSSMSDEITAIKNSMIGMMSTPTNSTNGPGNYVLVTFGDEENLTTGWVSTDRNVILRKLSGLKLSGGGECPQYAFSGILKAIELSLPGSTVYVYTDADAKDCYRLNEVMAAANAKEITLTFLLTGSCPGFNCHHPAKRMNIRTSAFSRGTDRANRAVRSLFGQLASGTGGIVQDTTKQEISNVLHNIIKNDFPSSQVIIDTFSVPATSGNDIAVYADADMQVMKIVVTGPASVSEVILKDPTGSTVTGTGTVGRYFSSSKAILSVQHPKAGTWTIQRTLYKEWKVNITAEARIHISFNFKEKDENGFPYEIKGNPIAGRKYTMEIKVSNLPGDPISTEAILVDDKRASIANFTTTLSSGIPGKIARISVVMLKKTFRIQLRCRYTNSSMDFRRTSERLVTPVTVQLSLQKIFDAVEIGVPQKLSYMIANTGSSSQTLTVKYTDDKNYHLSVQNSHEHLLSPGQRKRAFFLITGTKDAEPVRYNISVYEKGSNQILQTAEDTIMFTSIIHPKCTVVARQGNCSFLNNMVDCKTFSWNASVSVKFSGIKLNSVSLGNKDSNVHVHHAALSSASSPFHIEVSGSCCTPSVLVNVRDADSYVGTCLLKFGDPSQVQEHTVVDTVNTQPVSQDTDNSINGGAIAGITIAVVVVIGVLVFSYIYVTKKLKQAAKIQNK